MARRIEFKGQVHEFPANATDEQIRNALMAMSDAAPQQAASSVPESQRSARGFVGNVLKSGGKFLGGIVQAIASPVQTAKGIGQLGIGTAGNLAELVAPGSALANAIPYKDVSTAFGEMYAQRYGGAENTLRTLYEDPVGALADITSVTGAGGGVLTAASKGAQAAGLTRTAGALAKGGQVAKAASHKADPLRLARKGINIPLRAALSRTQAAERWYQSALKPQQGDNLPNIPNQIATGLSYRMPVSPGGAAKIRKSIDNMGVLRDAIIKKAVAEAGTKGISISAKDVTKRLGPTYAKFRMQVNPFDDIKDITKVHNEFNQMVQRAGLENMPAEIAQEILKGTYAQLRGKYGQQSTARVDAQKALARGIKEELNAAIPELSPVNAKMSDLISLRGQIDKAVNRIANTEIFGIGTPLATSAVKAMTGSQSMALVAGLLRATLSRPAIQSRLAIAIHNARLKNPAKFRDTRAFSALSRVNEYINSLDALIATEGAPDEDFESSEYGY